MQIRHITLWCIRMSLILSCAWFSSCAKKLSPLYKYNTYLDDFENYVINDSLRFIHKTYGNIQFPKSKSDLLNFLNSNFPEANGVLLAADSKDSTNMKYAILVNPTNKKRLLKDDYHSRDTLINKNHYFFISNKKWTLQGRDLKNSFVDAFYIGSDYQKKIPGIFDFQNHCSQTITFLRCLKGYLDYPYLDASTNDLRLQFALTYSSFLGNNTTYRRLLKKYNSKKDLSDEAKKFKKIGVSGWLAVSEKILDLSKDRQILMLSENHFKPQHRKTITLLLPELKKQGYTYLALEALAANSDSLLNSGSNVLNSMGFYTREQNYVELLETAQNLGFTLVSYDDFTKDREVVQAQNIFDKTLRQNSNAKIIVLAGFGHINEMVDSNGKQMMANHLKSISGIDPLTISQTTFSKHSFERLSQSILVECEKLTPEYKKKTDFSLIHPEIFGVQDVQNTNFKYDNPHDFDVQLDIYRLEDLEHKFSHVKMPPLKSILVPRTRKVELLLKLGKTYKYFISNDKAIMVDEGTVDL